jgi:chaperonin GroEL (HSP60 family)
VRGESLGMLRKAMWTGLYAGIGAASTMVARRLASKVWRVATGEEPPAKR